MRAQSSIELLIWICAGMLMFAASLMAFGKGFAQMGPAAANLEMQAFLATVFSSADSMGEHGSRVARVDVPQGISEFATGQGEAGWWASFSLRNSTWNRTIPYRLVIQPESLLYSPGAHAVKISRSGGVVFVEEIQGNGQL